jgi:hypothetical protein
MKTRILIMVLILMITSSVTIIFWAFYGIEVNTKLAFHVGYGILIFSAVLFILIKRENKAYRLARRILGGDLITPEEIMWLRRNNRYTKEQLAKFHETIPKKEILEWCHDNNFMLVAGPKHPMSLLEIRAMKNCYFYEKEGGWYAGKRQKFSQDEKVETKWYMICKKSFYKLTPKNWDEKLLLISEIAIRTYHPSASEFVWAITTYKAVRDVYLFKKSYNKETSSFSSDFDKRIEIGYFDRNGMDISFDHSHSV